MTPAETGRTRESQGLTPTVSDPGALAKIAALLAVPLDGDDGGKPPRRRERREGGV